MSKNRQKCICGSGNDMRRCCGAPSSHRKLELEASAKRLSDLGMHAEAAQVLSERARLSPQNPMIWNDLGVEHVAARQLQDAHQAFTRALRALADYKPSLYNLARLAIERCAMEKAKEHPSEEKAGAFATQAIHYLGKSLSIEPLDQLTHAALSTAYTHIGDSVRATFHATKASELKPVELAEPKRTWAEQLILKAFARPQSQAVLPFLFSTGEEVTLTGA